MLQLKITLDNLSPDIWRRVLVPDTITLTKLHQVIQIAMGWENAHLHEFEFDGQRYGEPDPDWDLSFNTITSEKRVKLKNCLVGIKRFKYLYDFGDNWEHTIVLEKSLPDDPALTTPLCLDGNGACPPEDVGGIYGYSDFLEIISDPKNPQREEMLIWFCADDFDPDYFDILKTNQRLLRIKA